MKNDPQDRFNLIHNDECKGILCEMKEILLEFYMATGDAVPIKGGSRRFGKSSNGFRRA